MLSSRFKWQLAHLSNADCRIHLLSVLQRHTNTKTRFLLPQTDTPTNGMRPVRPSPLRLHCTWSKLEGTEPSSSKNPGAATVLNHSGQPKHTMLTHTITKPKRKSDTEKHNLNGNSGSTPPSAKNRRNSGHHIIPKMTPDLSGKKSELNRQKHHSKTRARKKRTVLDRYHTRNQKYSPKLCKLKKIKQIKT